jgi:hypothetical protein
MKKKSLVEFLDAVNTNVCSLSTFLKFTHPHFQVRRVSLAKKKKESKKKKKKQEKKGLNLPLLLLALSSTFT